MASLEDKLQACPHCHTRLTNKEATTIIHGSGVRRAIPVRFPNGELHLMEIGDVFPSYVEPLEPKVSGAETPSEVNCDHAERECAR